MILLIHPNKPNKPNPNIGFSTLSSLKALIQIARIHPFFRFRSGGNVHPEFSLTAKFNSRETPGVVELEAFRASELPQLSDQSQGGRKRERKTQPYSNHQFVVN